MTKKRRYFELCLNCNDLAWLERSANDPGPHMTRMHVAIIRLAIRTIKRG